MQTDKIPYSNYPPLATSPLSIKSIQQHVEHMQQRVVETGNVAFLSVKPANTWIQEASLKPIPNKLLGELWYEGEVCILFADTNVGKSILAVQIANAISRQGYCLSFPPTIIQNNNVLYVDFELNDRQFYIRYTDTATNSVYSFSDNFFRAEINPDTTELDEENPDAQVIAEITKAIQATKASILIVDNITYLSRENEKAKNALPLMKQLKRIKSAMNISILVLAHTPKRDRSKPITGNDLQGSSMLMNFCDSAFAIGESHRDKRFRYIKQIKARNTEIVYDSNNVLLCEIKKENALLKFEFTGYVEEKEHLKPVSQHEQSEKTAWVLQLHEEGRSQRQIAKETNLPLTTVNRYLKKGNTNISGTEAETE
jgi:RecA-family ATPase